MRENRKTKTNKKTQQISLLRRASFTVEAAVIGPLLVFLIAALASLCFYEHDRVWFTGAACEAALAGNSADAEAEAAYARASARQAEAVLPGTVVETAVEGDEGGYRVAFAGSRHWALPWEAPAWRAEVEILRVHPTRRLQIWWALERLGKEVLEES